MSYTREIILVTLMLISFAVFAKENRVRIAVLDTGISMQPEIKRYLCSEGHGDTTGTGIRDRHGHGTNIAGLIAKNINPKTHCLVIVKIWNTSEDPKSFIRKYSEYLLQLKPDYVNMSFGGPEYDEYERYVLMQLTANGTIIFAAAGNSYKNFNLVPCDYYPACYNLKGMNVVAASDLTASNKGGPVKYYVRGMNQTALGITMSGSSQATAVATGLYIKGVLK